MLKGNGSASIIRVDGTIAPGLSPGSLRVLDTLYLNNTSSYQFEVLNANSYDQIAVGESHQGNDPAVQISQARLDTRLLESWSLKPGDSLRIIDNRSTTPIAGTFTGLAEGALFEQGGVTFSISYVGGDGNDIVVSVISVPITSAVPTAPSAGVQGVPNTIILIALTVISLLIAGMCVKNFRKYLRK